MIVAPINDWKYLALLGGQSNADGLHRNALVAGVASLGMGCYGIRQVNHGGKPIRAWLGAAHSGITEYYLDDFFNEDGTAYLQTQLANPVFDGLPIVLHWFQGEDDADYGGAWPDLYYASLNALLDRFGADCEAIGRPWYCVIYGVWQTTNGTNPGYVAVRAAQLLTATERENCLYFETKDYPRADGVHITSYTDCAVDALTAVQAFLPQH
jgi:hypothetical protein